MSSHTQDDVTNRHNYADRHKDGETSERRDDSVKPGDETAAAWWTVMLLSLAYPVANPVRAVGGFFAISLKIHHQFDGLAA